MSHPAIRTVLLINFAITLLLATALVAVMERLDAVETRPNQALQVTVTAYSPEKSQTDSTPYETAFMTRVKKGTVAVSEDLLEAGWVAGEKVYIKGLGVFTINDLMHPRKKRHLDIFVWETPVALTYSPAVMTAILLSL